MLHLTLTYEFMASMPAHEHGFAAANPYSNILHFVSSAHGTGIFISVDESCTLATCPMHVFGRQAQATKTRQRMALHFKSSISPLIGLVKESGI